MTLRTIKSIALISCFVAVASLAWTATGECQFTARLYTQGSYSSIHLEGGQWCVIAEPADGWQITDIDANSVYLWTNTYPIPGDVDRIYPSNKTLVVGDRDGNGIQDVQFCFTNADLNALFSNLHGNKPKSINLGLNGDLFTGGWFHGGLTIDVYPKN